MTPWLDDGDVEVYAGDCIEVMRTLPAESIDAIITDPPYGLGFMGREWDALPPGLPWALECLRVLKPGGHLAAFGGTRTAHRMTCAIEDAGFEIRDTLAWLYGSGFPKDHNVSKAIDKAAGAEGERGPMKRGGERLMNQAPDGVRDGDGRWGDEVGRDPYTYAPSSAEAREWSGWGTALKPAHEPITLARKPLAGTVAANVLKHGTGALHIDACRIETDARPNRERRKDAELDASRNTYGEGLNGSRADGTTDTGRWPANVILDADAAALLDELVSGRLEPHHYRGQPRFQNTYGDCTGGERATESSFGGDKGGASRFFYTAKASSGERNDGLHDLPVGNGVTASGSAKRCAKCGKQAVNMPGSECVCADPEWVKAESHAARANTHPTVKPVDLMRWLIRLTVPPGALILDPFAGSGTTGVAARIEQTRCTLIERETDYLPIIAGRLSQQSLFGESA